MIDQTKARKPDVCIVLTSERTSTACSTLGKGGLGHDHTSVSGIPAVKVGNYPRSECNCYLYHNNGLIGLSIHLEVWETKQC